jgi:bla regulator protein blaR1
MSYDYIKNWFVASRILFTRLLLIHSLWIGLVGAALAGGILTLTRRSQPALRYWLLSACFYLIVAGLVASFYLEYTSEPSAQPVQAFTATSSMDAVAVTNWERKPITSLKPNTTGIVRGFLDQNAIYIVIGWFLLFFIRAVSLTNSIYTSYQVRLSKTSPPPFFWQKRFEVLCKEMSVKKAFLLQSGCVHCPLTVGHLKATILMPVGLLTNLPVDQVESILLHELAHIKRHDYLVNFVQKILECLFFFNPGLIWVSELMRNERESCCDEMVIEKTGERETYLKALVNFQEYSLSHLSYSLALAGHKNKLLSRVKRILTGENEQLGLIERTILICGAIIVASFTFLQKKPPQTIIFTHTQKATLGIKKNSVTPSLFNSRQPTVQGNQDTIPLGDFRFDGVQFERSNDPKERRHTYRIKDTKGNHYTVTRQDDQMTALLVNGERIPLTNLHLYARLFNSAEQFLKNVYSSKQRAINSDTSSHNSKPVERKGIPIKSKTLGSKINPGKASVKKVPGTFLDLTDRKVAWQRDGQSVKQLMQELINLGFVASENEIEWFGIDEKQMHVNGRELPADLHSIFKQRYGIEKDKGLYYGPSRMHGTGIYYDKTDLKN